MRICTDTGISLKLKGSKDPCIWIFKSSQNRGIDRSLAQGEHPSSNSRRIPILDAKGGIHADAVLLNSRL